MSFSLLIPTADSYTGYSAPPVLNASRPVRHRFGEVTECDGSIRVDVSFPGMQTLFLREDGDRAEIGTDLRRLYRGNDTLDSAGIVSILTYGALIPPLSPFREIRTLVPGFRYTIGGVPLRVSGEPLQTWTEPSADDTSMGPEAQADRIAETLDRILLESCPAKDPVLLFSGGVDSSLIAARVAEMGWTGATLCHCSFGEHDPEGTTAAAIASILGLNMDVVEWAPEVGFECLERAVENYAHPFADYANVPNYTLLRSVAARYRPGRVILDGSGADGAWGLFDKAAQIRKLYSVPAPARYLAGLPYAPFRVWALPSRAEKIMKIFRKSIQFPDFTYVAALNPLAGIAYPGAEVRRVNYCLEHWIHSVAGTGDLEETLPLADIAVVCAGRYVPKSLNPLLERGFTVEFPFLHHSSLDLALRHGRYWPGSRLPKAAMKRLLCRYISPDLVYREKVGFTPPQIDLFGDARFLDHLRAVVDGNAPLLPFINRKFILWQLDRAVKRKKIAENTCSFLWAAAFLNTWLSQLLGVRAADTEVTPEAGLVWT